MSDAGPCKSNITTTLSTFGLNDGDCGALNYQRATVPVERMAANCYFAFCHLLCVVVKTVHVTRKKRRWSTKWEPRVLAAYKSV